jgi:hypothetical protein
VTLGIGTVGPQVLQTILNTNLSLDGIECNEECNSEECFNDGLAIGLIGLVGVTLIEVIGAINTQQWIINSNKHTITMTTRALINQ